MMEKEVRRISRIMRTPEYIDLKKRYEELDLIHNKAMNREKSEMLLEIFDKLHMDIRQKNQTIIGLKIRNALLKAQLKTKEKNA